MAKGANQKLKMLYLLDMLMRNTDEEHPLAMRDIIENLAALDITAERKSIYSDIEELRRFGVDIENGPKGYFVASREFEMPELKMLVDSVSASKFITEKKSDKLIKKIEALASRHEGYKLQRQVFIADRVKNVNEGIYYSVDTLSEAINKKRKISFKYFEYTPTKTKKFRNDGEEYVVSPYGLIVSDENYYLISHFPKHEKLTHFRVDRMCEIKITEEVCENAEAIMGKGFNIGEYSKKVFSMYAGESTRVEILCENSMMNSVIDRFGENVFVQKADDEHFIISVNVDISPTFFAWIFTFGGKMKITSPENVREEFNNVIRKFLE